MTCCNYAAARNVAHKDAEINNGLGYIYLVVLQSLGGYIKLHLMQQTNHKPVFLCIVPILALLVRYKIYG